jgi:peptidoglycan/LPS O-acetylase OafA/YrhL
MREPPKYIWVDALRAIAILFVIAVHSTGKSSDPTSSTVVAFQYGQTGVQLFFLASAITLCLSAASREDEGSPLLAFYARRYFRIAPLYYVGIVLYLVWSGVFEFHKTGRFEIGAQYTPWNIAANVLFFHGVYPPANNDIVPGGWSIGTEMIFYAMFPGLWQLLKGAGDRKQVWTFALLCLLAISVDTGIKYLMNEDSRMNGFLYFNIGTQLPVFLMGMVYYRQMSAGRRISHPAAMFLIFLLGTLVAWHEDLFLLLPSLSALSFLGVIQIVKDADPTVLRFLQPIGRVSYSMYVFHFFVLDGLSGLVFRNSKISQVIGPDVSLISIFVGATVITFAIANLTYRVIEKPFLAIGKRIFESDNPMCL